MKEMKKCYGKIGCGKIKPISEFHFANKRTGRLSDQCKECKNKIRRDQTVLKREKYNKDNGIVPGTDMCYNCKEVKEIKYFKKSKRRKNGYEKICRGCYKLKGQMKYYDNIELSRQKTRAYSKKYREDPKNREKDSAYTKKFFEEHPDYRRNYERNRQRNDVEFNLKKNLRGRLNKAIGNNQKSGSAIKDLGCSVKDLKTYLESKFYPNPETGEKMTWENHGLYGWHIDHIIPLASFDLTDREQFIKACHYTNLQPLWAKENFSKGAKMEWKQ